MHSPISGPPFSAVEATHSTHNHHRGGRHNHLPTRIMPACADLELCKAPDNPPLGERDGHGCRAGCGGRLHGMCGEQEEGESELHRICNASLASTRSRRVPEAPRINPSVDLPHLHFCNKARPERRHPLRARFASDSL